MVRCDNAYKRGVGGSAPCFIKWEAPCPPSVSLPLCSPIPRGKPYGLLVPKVESNIILDSHDCNCYSSSLQNAIETVVLLPLMTQKTSMKFNIIMNNLRIILWF